MLVFAGALVLLAFYTAPTAASVAARSVAASAVATSTTAGSLTARAAGEPLVGADGIGCVGADQATYRHSFNGDGGTARITALRPLCSGQSQTFTLLSYTTSSSNFAYPQFIYDQAQATIDAGHSSVELAVTVPRCYFQVDLIFGGAVYTEVVNTDSNYGNLIVGAPFGIGSRSSGPYAGDADGTAACTPKPIITYQDACNATFTATLANDPSANVDAVFLVAGRRLRVAPGRSVTSKPYTGTVIIRDSTFTTTIGSWERPPTGCDPASSPSAALPPTAPAPTASAAVSVPAYAAPPASTTDPLDAADNALPIITGSPSPPPSALSATGMSFTSEIVIALGVLLMAGGLIVLVRVLRTVRHS